MKRALAILIVVVAFVGLNAGQISRSSTAEQQLKEKTARTKIISYQKNELAKKKILDAMDNMKTQFKCEIEHLPFLGVFIVTFQNIDDTSACNSLLPDDVIIASNVLSKIKDRDLNGFKQSSKYNMHDNAPIYNVSSIPLPNDPSFDGQWALQNLQNEADINAQEGWKEYKDQMKDKTGGQDIVVAVSDSGVDYEHPDLKNVMWNNPEEIPGNGIDDDRNGIIDDFYGANFIDGEVAGDPMDKAYGHGTHCTGIIHAEGNNDIGVAGVASFSNNKIKIMALKTIQYLGPDLGDYTTDAWMLKALEYAGSHGVRVSSHSYGIDRLNPQEELWTDIMLKHPEQLYVTSAGNAGLKITEESTKPFPCTLKAPNVLCVGASNRDDERWQGPFWGSNYGKDYVHLFAPGQDVLSTFPSLSYKLMNGTSMACPHVAGLAALVMSMGSNADGQDAIATKDLILQNVQKKPQYEGLVSTGGLMDMKATIHAARQQRRFQN